MAALTKDSIFRYLGNPVKMSFSSNQAATAPFYAGSLVYIDTAGGVQSVPAVADIFIGISPKQQAVAIGAEVEVLVDGIFLLPLGGSITAANEGDVLIHDVSATQSDNPTDTAAYAATTVAVGGSSDQIIGDILRVTTEGMWVKLTPGKTIKTDAGIIG